VEERLSLECTGPNPREIWCVSPGVDGQHASGATGLDFQASNSSIKSLGFVSFGGDALHVEGSNDTLANNWIGYNPVTNAAQANSNGVVLQNGAGHVVLSGNYIENNTGDGVKVLGASSNTLQSNKILANGRHGVLIGSASTSNTLDSNLVSGNAVYGVYVTDPGTTGNPRQQRRVGHPDQQRIGREQHLRPEHRLQGQRQGGRGLEPGVM
jgi:parallel beta-helix repeat protein